MILDSEAHGSRSGGVRPAHRFDEQRLERWLVENVEDYCGPMRVEQFAGGQSNPTFKLITPNRNYVMRRRPPGELLKGAHAVDREARVQQALGTIGFPVARVHALCTDDSVIGTWFYVMDMIDGRIFTEATFPEAPAADRPKHFDAMNETMARLHRVDAAAIGLADYGRPGNYFTRQISRWSKQYLADELAGRLSEMDRLVEWLPQNIPEGDETTIVHGDYGQHNLIFHPTEPKVAAVLDWELSTLGHPLGDFGYLLLKFHLTPEFGGIAGLDLKAIGYPSREEYVEAYCGRTGRSGIGNLDFYIAFNMFRLAAIHHGIKGRLLRGTAASPQAEEAAARVPTFAALAWQQAQRAGA